VSSFDGALGERVGDLRQRHADRRGAQVAQHLGDLPGGAAHLDALQVIGRLDQLVLHVEHAGAVHVQRKHLRVLEFVGGDGLHILPVRLRGRLGVVHHEWQLEHFDAGEATRGVGGQRPDDVDDAVLGLVVQLHRRATELHRRIALELDAPAGLLLDLFHPRLVHGEPHVGLRRHEGVELERHGLLRQAAQAGGAQRHGRGGFQEGASLDHVVGSRGMFKLNAGGLRGASGLSLNR
jgi:hypothetical protein